MKFWVRGVELAEALAVAQRGVQRTISSPIYAAILFQAEKGTGKHDGKLTLTGTDGTTTFKVVIPAYVEQSCGIALPARLMNEICSDLKGEERVEFNEIDTSVWTADIWTSSYRSSIKGFRPYDFPPFPREKEDWPAALSGPKLREVAERVIVASARMDNRPILNTICFDFRDNGIVELACADGYRLAVEQLPFVGELRGQYPIDREAMLGILRILPKTGSDVVQMAFDDRMVHIATENAYVTTVCPEGRFPDYAAAVPKTWATQMKADRASLVRSLKVAEVFARDSANCMRAETMTDMFGDGLKIFGKSAERGDNDSGVPIELTGEPTAFNVNVRYMIEAAETTPGAEVLLQASGEMHPVILRAADPASSFYAVVMPMSVKR